jgi:hypothetical protein
MGEAIATRNNNPVVGKPISSPNPFLCLFLGNLLEPKNTRWENKQRF